MKTELLRWMTAQLHRSENTPATGYLGELIVMQMLSGSSRWQVYRPRTKKAGDLWVTDTISGEVLRVEVKTATTGWQRSFQFCLRKQDRYGTTTIDHADVVVLLCVDVDEIYPYVIPAKFFEGRMKVSISSHPEDYNGRWARFRQEADALCLATDKLNLLVANFHGYETVQYAVV